MDGPDGAAVHLHPPVPARRAGGQGARGDAHQPPAPRQPGTEGHGALDVLVFFVSVCLCLLCMRFFSMFLCVFMFMFVFVFNFAFEY